MSNIRFAVVAITLLAFAAPAAAQGTPVWDVRIEPSPGGRVLSLTETPFVNEYEVGIPYTPFVLYSFEYIDWEQHATGTCSTTSPSGCVLSLSGEMQVLWIWFTDVGKIPFVIPFQVPNYRLTFTAVPDPGYYFHGWDSFPSCGNAVTCQPEFPVDYILRPVFTQCPPGGSCITVQSTPSNLGTVHLHSGDANGPVEHSCTGLCTFQVPQGSEWTLTATTLNGAIVSDWAGCDATPEDRSCVMTDITTDRRVSAKYKYPLTMTNTSPFVLVHADDERKYIGSCLADRSPCTFLVDPGANVGFTRIVAAPEMDHYRHSESWVGCTPMVLESGEETASLCNLTMTGPKAIETTYFAEFHFRADPPEHGRIVGTPGDIDCSPTSNQCDAWLPVYSTLTLTATADPGYTLFSWDDGRVGFPGGACAGAGSSATCTVALNGVPQLTGASFFANVSVQVSGGGGVQMIVDSAAPYDTGITCPAVAPNLCRAVAPGSTVTLTPTAFPRYNFSGWSGACSGTGACAPVVTVPTTITASFSGTHQVLVSTAAFGVVSLSSTAAPIRCFYGCTTTEPMFGGGNVEYSTGTTVNLTAIQGTVNAYPNYVFAGWGGACTGISPTCSLLMGTELVDPDGITRVIANFVYGAQTSINVIGGGRVTSDLPGVNCTQMGCGQYMAAGNITTLTATPNPGWRFAGWSGGGCGGTGTCTPQVRLDPPFGTGNPPITATFIQMNADLVALGLSHGTLTPAFSASTVAYAATVGYGVSSLTVTPVLNDGLGAIAVRVNGGAYEGVADGTPSAGLLLNVGANTVDVRATSSDGIATRTYTVTVTRAAIASGDVDPTFDPNTAGTAYGIAVQPDRHTLLVAGTEIGGVFRRAARLNADGTADAGFDPNVDGVPQQALVQADGKIVIGGSFTAIDGVTRNRVARLHADGSLDTDFDPDVNADVFALQGQPDGSLLVGGWFSRVKGEARNGVARVLADGSVDPGFAPSVNGAVYALALQPDGKVVIGGGFTEVNGVTRFNIARLNADGTLDTGFAATADNRVASLAIQADGRVLAGGFFTSMNGVGRWQMARLNADGTLDQAFNPNPNDTPETFVVQADGRIILAGRFTTLNFVPRNRIARLNADGSLDAGFNPDAGGWVRALALQADGQLLVSGDFGSIGGLARIGLARIANEGATESLTVPSAGRIEWLRGGSSPEASYVTFELSTDGGANYTSLGVGTRIAGGWEITGLSLPANGQIRARARVTGGNGNASSGLVESVATFDDLPDVPEIPEIAVSASGVNINDGGQADFGAADVAGAGVVKTLTITNTGTADLTVGSVSLDGAHAADFTVTTQPASPVTAGGSTTFQVTFDPTDAGVRSATLSFTSNDADETPFDVSITGTGTMCPAITLVSVPDVTYGGSTTLSASLAAIGVSVAGRSIQFAVNGTSVGSAATDDSGIATLSGVSLAALNGGAYPVTASFAGDGGCPAVSASASLTIVPATPTLQVTGGTFPYDGDAHEATGTATGILGEDLGPLTFTYNGEPSAPSAAGVYTVAGSFAGNSNYTAASATTTLTITAPPPPPPPPGQITPLASPAAFSGSETTITFQGAPFPVTEFGGVLFRQNGQGLRRGTGDCDGRPFGPQECTTVDNDLSFSGSPIEMTFPTRNTRLAFESRFNGHGAGVTVTFFNGTEEVGSAVTPPGFFPPSPNPWVFAGFEVPAGFDRVVLRGPNNGYLRLDNVRFEAVQAPPPPPPPPPAPGIKGHWTFEEGTGDHAADETSSQNHGVLRNGAAWSSNAAPIEGNTTALALDGVDDWVEVAHAPSLNFTTAATFAAWINPSSHPYETHGVISKPREDGTGFALRAEAGFANAGFNNASTNCSFGGGAPLVPGVWTHIAASYDGSGANGVINLYVDGVLVASTTAGHCPGITGPIDDSTHPLQIGREFDHPGIGFRAFAGLIDEARVYDAVLSAEEIAQLAVRTLPPADTTPPVLSVPADIVADATGPDGAVASFSVAATDDTDPAPSVSCSAASGDTFALGETQVSCAATDAAGNSASASFTVTVRDVAFPTVVVSTSPDLVTRTVLASASVTASDAVGLSSVTINGIPASLTSGTPQSGTWSANIAAPVAAAFTITAIATDLGGNAATATLVVDNDGIPAEIDTAPGTFSDAFSDVALGGATSGVITNRGAGVVTVIRTVPHGVVLEAALNTQPARIGMCPRGGVEEIVLPRGGKASATCFGTVLLGELGTFVDPQQVAVDPLGNVYVADGSASRIVRFSGNGTPLGEFPLVILGNPRTASGVAATSTGLWVVTQGLVFRYQLVSPCPPGSLQLAPGVCYQQQWGGYANPSEAAVDAQGYLYVADTLNNRIKKTGGDGAHAAIFGSGGAGEGQFDGPRGVAVDASGFVYVADTNNHRIQKLTSSGLFVRMWGTAGSGAGQFSSPQGIAIDDNGFVYVADTMNHRVQVFTADGAFVEQWGTASEFSTPVSVAVGGHEVYVVDNGNKRVRRFSRAGGLHAQSITDLSRIIRRPLDGPPPYELDLPPGQAVLLGSPVVADPGNTLPIGVTILGATGIATATGVLQPGQTLNIAPQPDGTVELTNLTPGATITFTQDGAPLVLAPGATVVDQCPGAGGNAAGTGCPTAIRVKGTLRTIDIRPRDRRNGRDRDDDDRRETTVGPLDADVRVFDLNDRALRAIAGRAVTGRDYDEIFEADKGRISECRIDSQGTCLAGLAKKRLRKYLVIARLVEQVDTDGDGVPDTRYNVYSGHVVTGGHHDWDDCDDDKRHRKHRDSWLASVKLSVVKITRRGVFQAFEADAVVREP